MNSAEFLTLDDRCKRAPYLAKRWEKSSMTPLSALYLAIEEGLGYEGEEDPGQISGDHVMTIATERYLDIPSLDQYGTAMHYAALADLIVFVLRTGAAWQRPEDTKVGREPWESSAWLNEAGTGLRRVVLVDRWNDERKLGESHSWKTAGECAAYGLPMKMIVVVIGQSRDGRRSTPWSKGWRHPVNDVLRMRKRNGKGFDGAWVPVMREDTDYSRELWLETMTEDGVLADCLFEVDVEYSAQGRSNIGRCAEQKLVQIREQKTLPSPHPSQCDDPIAPCQFRTECWAFRQPSLETGFIKVTA
jgi:hypothetical protein